MKIVWSRLSAWLVVFAFMLPGSASAQGQEITDAHLRAAWNAVVAVGAADGFDEALPDIAEQVQGVLIRQRPDLFRQVGTVVGDVALGLIARRLELNNDVARVWAMNFTESELNEIVTFYNSPTGQKLGNMFQELQEQTTGALEAWYERLASEMLQRSLQEFERLGIAF